MLLTERLSIQSKLVLRLLLVSIGSMFVISVIGYTSGREALEQSVYHHMTSEPASRADQLQTRIKHIRAQAITLSEDRMVVAAMREFLKSYRDLAQRALEARKRQGRVAHEEFCRLGIITTDHDGMGAGGEEAFQNVNDDRPARTQLAEQGSRRIGYPTGHAHAARRPVAWLEGTDAVAGRQRVRIG
jgi:hypothetical protein